mmetsp:Transcript_37092/g.116704  ORF Transcript_37092/g.116704 Transcript_37092/m.116704 type:complete len:216 (-) Transcript_37092:871-1518(-)
MSLFECVCRVSILSRPSASSMYWAYSLVAPGPAMALMLSPTLRMFSRPSSATVTMRASVHARRSQRGLMHPCCTRKVSCSWLPPEVALEMAHAASFLMSNSALARSCTRGGMMLASMMDWIWSLLPAVMLEMVQHASFLIDFLWLLIRRFSRHGSALQLMMIWVCRSSPVTMFPTVRSAGMSTEGEVWLVSSSTRRWHTPASMTAWILSLVPSER